MFSETAQATEVGAVTPGATETGADTHGAMKAGAVIHWEPILEVLVITEEAVTGPKEKKMKYIPDQVDGTALATAQVKQKSPWRPFKNSEGEWSNVPLFGGRNYTTANK